jgi:transcriptional regulator with XRE-family HTH domain
VPGRGPDQIDKHVAKRLRMRRMMLGMSQEKVADALDLTFQQVQKYEKASNRISAGRLLRLANLLEVPVPYFFEDAPGTTNLGGKARTPEYVSDLLNTKTGVAMAKAFRRIRKGRIRRSIVALIQAIADDDSLNQ